MSRLRRSSQVMRLVDVALDRVVFWRSSFRLQVAATAGWGAVVNAASGVKGQARVSDGGENWTSCNHHRAEQRDVEASKAWMCVTSVPGLVSIALCRSSPKLVQLCHGYRQSFS